MCNLTSVSKSKVKSAIEDLNKYAAHHCDLFDNSYNGDIDPESLALAIESLKAILEVDELLDSIKHTSKHEFKIQSQDDRYTIAAILANAGYKVSIDNRPGRMYGDRDYYVVVEDRL